jgi:hypothetical protein
MTQSALSSHHAPARRHAHVRIDVPPALENRNRLTCLFRPILAIPHVLLVGAPFGFVGLLGLGGHVWHGTDWSIGGGALAAVACVCALIAWVEILVTGKESRGLWDLRAFYLRWRVRAAAYAALLRDEYPPFGDADYPAALHLDRPPLKRDRFSVAFRLLMALPHIVVLWALGIVWVFATVIAWLSILLRGQYPATLFEYATGVLRWSTRVEAYVLLLTDAYPPFYME